jgi:hypothetical protein
MFSKVLMGRWAYGSFFELHVKRGINRSRNVSFTLLKVDSWAYFMFCFDFHVLRLEFKHDFATIFFDFFVPWKSLCLCNFRVWGNFNNIFKASLYK